MYVLCLRLWGCGWWKVTRVDSFLRTLLQFVWCGAVVRFQIRPSFHIHQLLLFAYLSPKLLCTLCIARAKQGADHHHLSTTWNEDGTFHCCCCCFWEIECCWSEQCEQSRQSGWGKDEKAVMKEASKEGTKSKRKREKRREVESKRAVCWQLLLAEDHRANCWLWLCSSAPLITKPSQGDQTRKSERETTTPWPWSCGFRYSLDTELSWDFCEALLPPEIAIVLALPSQSIRYQ